MQVLTGQMVPLGYGKFFRSDSIMGLEPIENDRGPGRRTRVYVDACDEPLVASRSEDAILRDLTGAPREMARGREQYQLLSDILDTVGEINPVLRSIIRDQGKWDLDRLEERIRGVLSDSEQES